MKKEFSVINGILKENPFEIILYPTEEKKSFNTIRAFEDYISNECQFWEKLTEGNINNIAAQYKSVLVQIEQLKNINGSDLQQTNTKIDELRRNFSQRRYRLSSLTYTGKNLAKLYIINKNRANYAYATITNDRINFTNNTEQFFGTIDGYNIFSSDEINLYKKDFEKDYLEIVSKHDKRIAQISEDHHQLISEYSKELLDAQDVFHNTADRFNNNIVESNKKFDAELSKWSNNISQLEKTYSELLRLQAPIKYWEELETKYKDEGNNYKTIAMIIASVFICVLILIFYFFPEWLKGPLGKDQIKGTIIFTLIVSVFSYILHLFVKLALSSIHLSRDATERKQLTHVFLALLKDKAIEPKEKELVFQSIFSRADTGLLKGDSGPTMPYKILDTIVNRNNRG